MFAASPNLQVGANTLIAIPLHAAHQLPFYLCEKLIELKMIN